MPQIECSCGFVYDSSYLFCPICGTKKPTISSKVKITEETTTIPSKKLGFRKIDNTSPKSQENDAEEKIEHPSIKRDLKADTLPNYYDKEEEKEEETNKNTSETYDDTEYEEEDTDPEYEDDEDDEYEDDEDESEYEFADEVEEQDIAHPTIAVPSIGRKTIPSKKENPMSKQTSSATNKKTIKKKDTYEPNYDGYYDDRLPAILDEVTKTSHMDVILKSSLAIVCVVALIVYCIFYVNI